MMMAQIISEKTTEEKKHEHEFTAENVYLVETPDESMEVIVLYRCDYEMPCHHKQVWASGYQIASSYEDE